MIVETYKVKAVTGPGYGQSTETILGVEIFFRLWRNGVRYNVSTTFYENWDYSFTEWNKLLHDLLSSDTI